MAQYAFFFDASRCTGCKTCMFACKDFNNLSETISFRQVYVVSGGTTERKPDGSFATSCVAYAVSSACQHCSLPTCVVNCPTGAMAKEDETGLVLVDAHRCIGCGMCATVCPYNAPKVDIEAGHSVKCDGCVSRVHEGLKPVCVLACPVRALDFGLAHNMEAKGERADIAPFCDATVTMPNLFIKPCPDALPAGDPTVVIENPAEIV